MCILFANLGIGFLMPFSQISLFQIEQLENILSEKNKAIEELSVSLQSVTENRDLLQAEYMEQASQLTQQVHTLQEQLRQVT